MAERKENPYSALLIGSWEGHRTRDGDKRIDMKGGIKRSLSKSDDNLRGKWARGYLNNMESFLGRKGYDVHKLNYVEYKENSGTDAEGKDDILPTINRFFKQKNKTYFVLYFTGHGAVEDGSWYFAVTRPMPMKTADDHAATGTDMLRTASTSSSATTASEPKIVTFHDESGDDEPAHEQSADHSDLGVGVSKVDSTIQPAAALRESQTRNTDVKDRKKKMNDFVSFEEVLKIWDKNKKGRERYLMMILDCCHAGKWVEMVNALTIETAQGHVKRRDICVQAACRPVESSMVASNQCSSVFTRDFIAAQSKSSFEKVLLSAIDHLLVLSVVSIACSPIQRPFTPISTDLAPFGGIKFFDSFDFENMKVFVIACVSNFCGD